MNNNRLRDRDSIVTPKDIIFRVYGYTHPPQAFICDVEYAPASMYKSKDPRAKREGENQTVYFKFFSDQGLQFVRQKYPQYTIWYKPLQTRLVGVHLDQIKETRKPEEALMKLLACRPSDSLLQSLHMLLDIIIERSGLSETDFGVFGSLLHGFYNPKFSDLDFTVYDGEKLKQLRETLKTMYKERSSHLKNEFETEDAVKEKSKRWSFVNYTPQEYCWHQRRKTIYAVFRAEATGRYIKTEFEPVKNWKEIHNEYDPMIRVFRKGWIKAIASIVDDSESPFMPSIYGADVKRILEGKEADDIRRIVSYIEEFRMQAERGEEVYVEGNLEQVVSPRDSFHQITLSYGPRYYEQVLKVAKPYRQ